MSTQSIEALTTQALSTALDATSLRHRVIAANIAHADTPGHAAQRVKFDEFLVQGATNSGAPRSELRARTEPTLDSDGRPQRVHLDTEMAALAQNALHQQVLLRALQRHLGLMALAASEGHR